MKQGFVTIATGDERYYMMARNLLRSYRQNCSRDICFAVIADRQNEYTTEFDDVVILENPTNSWMDKLSLLQVCPYDENIFIDADCLIYQNIDFFWDLFAGADDFSCFGQVLPKESKDGWFTAEAAQVYPIQFITHLHGMLYFIRKSNRIECMYKLCQNIIENYSAVKYRGFNDKLADEPVFALAMAILGLKPIERKPNYYCFVPFATEIRTNYLTRNVSFSNPKDGVVSQCCIVHWGNQNTLKAQYRFDAHICNYLNQPKRNMLFVLLGYKAKLLQYWFISQDSLEAACKWGRWFFERLIVKLKSIFGKR